MILCQNSDWNFLALGADRGNSLWINDSKLGILLVREYHGPNDSLCLPPLLSSAVSLNPASIGSCL